MTSFVNKPNRQFLGLCGLAVAAGLALSQPCQAKRAVFQAPAYEKLISGAGPATNDVLSRTTAINTPSNGAVSLSPLTLNEAPSAEAQESSGAYLKSTITATGFAPKGPLDPGSKSLFQPKDSLNDRLGEKSILKEARNVNAMPLPLMQSEEEAQSKIDTILDAEKTQMADLWESALTRSPDIQFVVQKLMPSSNPGHASAVMLRMLSSAIFGAMGSVSMMAPGNYGMYAANSMGANMVGSLLGLQENKIAKNARLSQTEGIMLYNIVRNTADKLVENYRNYKKSMSSMSTATNDLQDLQKMVAEARAAQDAPRQLEMEYTLRKAQRELDEIAADVRRYRQSLVDLAGSDSVAKLDNQLVAENTKVEEQTPSGAPAPASPAEANPKQETAHTGASS